VGGKRATSAGAGNDVVVGPAASSPQTAVLYTPRTIGVTASVNF
jgi:hypothetical protein